MCWTKSTRNQPFRAVVEETAPAFIRPFYQLLFLGDSADKKNATRSLNCPTTVVHTIVVISCWLLPLPAPAQTRS